MDEQKPPKEAPRKAPVVGAEVTVGCRVRVHRDAGATASGVVVEDYAALVHTGERGHDWAPAHRWAIALDDGRLVFADTTDLTLDTAAGSSDPPR